MEEWLQNELDKTVRWIYTSENKTVLSEQDTAKFYHSWVYNQGLCTIEEGTKVIRINFPWVSTLLLKELSKRMIIKAIPDNPIVKGFIFEDFSKK